MRKILITGAIAIMVMSICSIAFADTYVRGHYRNNGTRVEGHYRSDRNDSVADNWSTRGNINPHTGKPGYRNPW